MKKGLLALLLPVMLMGFFCGPNTGYREPQGKKAGEKKPRYHPKESFENFSRNLNLTKDQQEKIRPILNDEVDRIKRKSVTETAPPARGLARRYGRSAPCRRFGTGGGDFVS